LARYYYELSYDCNDGFDCQIAKLLIEKVRGLGFILTETRNEFHTSIAHPPLPNIDNLPHKVWIFIYNNDGMHEGEATTWERFNENDFNTGRYDKGIQTDSSGKKMGMIRKLELTPNPIIKKSLIPQPTVAKLAIELRKITGIKVITKQEGDI